MRHAPPAALAAFVLSVMALFSIADWSTLRHHDGIDFWQFWGVTQARDTAPRELGSPYLDAEHYQETLERQAEARGDASLLRAIHFRKRPDLTASPLLYAAFAAMPTDYGTSLTLYRCLQGLVFLLSAFLLLQMTGITGIALKTWLAIALLAAYDPLMFDMAVGNVNALQLFAMTAALRLSLNLHRHDSAGECLTAAIVATLLTLLALLKPNVGAALLMLGLTLLVRTTTLQRLVVVLSGIATVSVVLLVTIEVFDTWTVWLDWWRLTFGSVGRLSYPLDTGNQSISLYLAAHLRLETANVMGALALLWLAGLCLAVLWPLRGRPRLFRMASQRLVELLRDPGFGMAIGIVALYLLSPLSWPHYYVLGLLPAFWLLREEESWSVPALMAWLALLLMAGFARRIHAITGSPPDSLMFASRVFAWLPLLAGILVRLASAHPNRGR